MVRISFIDSVKIEEAGEWLLWFSESLSSHVRRGVFTPCGRPPNRRDRCRKPFPVDLANKISGEENVSIGFYRFKTKQIIDFLSPEESAVAVQLVLLHNIGGNYCTLLSYWAVQWLVGFFPWQHFVNQEDILKSKWSLKHPLAPPQLTHYNVAKRGSPKTKKGLQDCAVGLRDLCCYGGGGVDWSSSLRHQNVVY